MFGELGKFETCAIQDRFVRKPGSVADGMSSVPLHPASSFGTVDPNYALFMRRATIPSRKLTGCSLFNERTAPSDKSDLSMALLNFVGGRAEPQSYTLRRPRAVNSRVGTSRRTVLEVIGTFLVLIGISVGVLALRLALVLIHGVMH